MSTLTGPTLSNVRDTFADKSAIPSLPRPSIATLEAEAAKVFGDPQLSPAQKWESFALLNKKAERDGGLNLDKIIGTLDGATVVRLAAEMGAVDRERRGFGANDNLQHSIHTRLEKEAAAILGNTSVNGEYKVSVLKELQAAMGLGSVEMRDFVKDASRMVNLPSNIDPAAALNLVKDMKKIDDAFGVGGVLLENNSIQKQLKEALAPEFVKALCNPKMAIEDKLGLVDTLREAGFSHRELRDMVALGREQMRDKIIPQMELNDVLKLHQDMKVLDKQLGNDLGLAQNNGIQSAIEKRIATTLAAQLAASNRSLEENLELLNTVHKIAGEDPIKESMRQLSQNVDVSKLNGQQALALIKILKATDQICGGCSENNWLEADTKAQLGKALAPELAGDAPLEAKLQILSQIKEIAGEAPLKEAMKALSQSVDVGKLTKKQMTDLWTVIKRTDELCKGCSENNDLEGRIKKQLSR